MVDDDPDGLFFMRLAFKTAGVVSELQTVNSGKEAIAYLKGEGCFSDRSLFPFPDFIITDLKMPGIDGFGVLEFIKHNPPTATIPVVVLSGSQDNHDITKAYLLGASSYHVKPGATEALRALAKALFNYWILCELPDVDHGGTRLESSGSYKLGERSVTPPLWSQHGDA